MYRVEHYLSAVDRKDPYFEWLQRLRDNHAKLAVVRLAARVECGNFGDHKFYRDGVWELRVDVGPGYRVYYTVSGNRVVAVFRRWLCRLS